MARELTSGQQTNVELGATRPIYLVEWAYNGSGGNEFLSCSGDVTYDSQAYTAGGITITSLDDSKVCTLSFPATSSRIAKIQNNTWRMGVCKVTAILAAPGDTPTYSASDGLLVLDGVIESVTYSGEVITVTAKSKYYTGALVPRWSYDDVVTATPAVGQTSDWNGETISYEQWLKTTAAIQRLVRPGVNPQVTGRPSTSEVNSFTPLEDPGNRLLTAQGVNIPVVYGRASVPGYIFAEGETGGGNKFVGVAWCMGEVQAVEATFINDEVLPSSVTAKHYRGTTTQTVSPALQTYTATSPLFSDDMILRTPSGNVGICYSVYNVPTSAVTGAARFRAIIQGRLVEDPSSSALPFDAETEWSFNFLEGATDSGPNSYTLTLNGNAAINSPSIGLELDGTAGTDATIPNGTAIGSSPFSLELELLSNTAAASPGTQETLITNGSTASPLSRSLQIDRLGDEILLYLSSDGSTWDIADGLSCGTLAATGSPEVVGRLLVERVDNQFSTYLDGGTQTGVVSALALYDTGEVWTIGAEGSANEADIIVRSARLTIGLARYGSPHAITNTPFSDSGTYTAGTVYSENPILCANNLAKDAVNGLGATTTGVEAAAAYCDTSLDSGAPRCRIGIAISEPRLVEAWLDQLVITYGNGLWFPEGSDIKFIPDRSQADGQSGSGPELYSPTSPEFGSPLPTITTEDGVEYSINFTIDTEATTSPLVGVAVNFGGTEVIAEKTTAGTHGVRVEASGTSNTIEVIPNGSFDGTWSGLSVKRTHRAITQWMKSTLSVQGLPEGDKPNAVQATYNIPDDTSGAWKQNTFPVINAAAAAGEPIVLTKLSLPGVNRIEEASNKAIAALYRQDSKTRISLVSTDEEFVAQPGDTVQVTKSSRGIDTPVWVESNRMLSYGRHQITGTIYRDNQYPDTDYTLPKKFDETGAPEEAIGEQEPLPPACTPYSCSALEDYLDESDWINGQSFTTDTVTQMPWPFSATGSDGKLRAFVNLISSPSLLTSWSTSGPSTNSMTIVDASHLTGDLPSFCDGDIYTMGAYNGPQSPVTAILPPTDTEWGNPSMVALISGFNAGTTMDGSLLRNTGKYWSYSRGGTKYIATQDYVGANISKSGSDYILSVHVNNNLYGYPDNSDSVNLGDISGELSAVTVTITSGEPYETNSISDPTKFCVGITITVTASCNGQTASVTAVQVSGNTMNSSNPPTSITPATNNKYTEAQMFYGAQFNFGEIYFLSDASDDELDAAELALARNFSDYELPGYC